MLLSSASMFEHFMPLLVMRAYPGTLLDETYHAVVERQIQYGAQRRAPWAFPNPPTTHRTSRRTISTVHSAPGSA